MVFAGKKAMEAAVERHVFGLGGHVAVHAYLVDTVTRCAVDREHPIEIAKLLGAFGVKGRVASTQRSTVEQSRDCLLYTSDAADE